MSDKQFLGQASVYSVVYTSNWKAKKFKYTCMMGMLKESCSLVAL